MAEDFRREVYQQDCQSWRHQDNLQWSRFQTAATIEAGMLYGLYQTSVSAGEKIGLAFFASLLVLIVSGLGLKDNMDARGHLNRAAQIENGGCRMDSISMVGSLGHAAPKAGDNRHQFHESTSANKIRPRSVRVALIKLTHYRAAAAGGTTEAP